MTTPKILKKKKPKRVDIRLVRVCVMVPADAVAGAKRHAKQQTVTTGRFHSTADTLRDWIARGRATYRGF